MTLTTGGQLSQPSSFPVEQFLGGAQSAPKHRQLAHQTAAMLQLSHGVQQLAELAHLTRRLFAGRALSLFRPAAHFPAL